MTDKENGFSLLFEFFKFVIALCLEKYIPHGKSLIHNKDFRFNINGNRKCQTDKHTAGIGFHRLVHIFSDICKVQNILQFLINFFLGKAQHGAIEVHVFDTVVLHVESGSQLQQG